MKSLLRRFFISGTRLQRYYFEIRGRKTRRTTAVHITDYGNKIKQKTSIGFPTDVFVWYII